MQKRSGSFPSASGLADIKFYFYLPDSGKPRAAVMLSHGMCDHIERYEGFARYLCENDIALFGCDHVGHGNSVISDSLLGYFGKKHGCMNMIRDLHRMKHVAERVIPDIPHFLLGHSFGSFLARIYLARFHDSFSGAIIMGTAGKIACPALLVYAADSIANRSGMLFRDNRIGETAFRYFNLRTQNCRTSYDWLSRDDSDVEHYKWDRKCSFIFTCAGYRDMLRALELCNSEQCIENTPRALPILFMSGSMDPIGEYSDGVQRVFKRFCRHGCNARLKLYHGARHELLFELNRAEVMRDILKYLLEQI